LGKIPGWYTAYTPYQARDRQGRLEALITIPNCSNGTSGIGAAMLHFWMMGHCGQPEAMTDVVIPVKSQRKEKMRF